MRPMASPRSSVHTQIRNPNRVRLWGAGTTGLPTQKLSIERCKAEATKKGNER